MLTGGEIYWLGPVHDLDDFGNPIHNRFVDGCISRDHGGNGAWAIMVPEAHSAIGTGLGTGLGQLYEKQEDGRWLRIEG